MSFQAKYTTSKTIAGAITKNAKAHASVDQEWHDIGMSVMAHIWANRDVSVVNNLVIPMYKGLGKGARHVAMTAWLLEFLPVVANDDKATKDTHPFKFSKAKAEGAPNFEDAQVTPWYSMKPSPTPDQFFDVKAMMLAVIKKASTAHEKGTPLVGDYKQMVAVATALGLSASDLPESGWVATKKKAVVEAAIVATVA